MLFHLFSGFPSGLQLDWTTLLLFSVTTSLVFRLIEGGWWTFFVWLKGLLGLFIHHVASSERHQPFPRDVRFLLNISLNVTLTGFNATLFRTSWTTLPRTSNSGHHQFLLTMRARSGLASLRRQRHPYRPYRPLHCLERVSSKRRRYLNSLVTSEVATRNLPVSSTTETSNRSQTSTTFEHSPNYMDYYEACTDYSCPRLRDKLEFESYYGLSRQAAWAHMDAFLHPLDWFLNEKTFRQSNVLTISSQDRRLGQAFYAAIALLSQLGVEDNTSKLAGAFLTSESTSSEIPLVFDTGCGFSIAPCRDDFIGEVAPAPQGIGVTDFANGRRSVEGIGTVEWSVRDSLGRTSVIRTQAYYLPSATVRLFCPYQYHDEHNQPGSDVGTYSCRDNKLTFVDEYGTHLQFVLTPSRRLPIMDLDESVPQVGVTDRMFYNFTVIRDDPEAQHLFDEANHNLTNPQKELKLWHCRLAHAGFPWVQDLMRVQKTLVGDHGREPIIPTKFATSSRCSVPKCSACIFAKQHRRTPRTQMIVTHPETEMAI